MAAVPNDYEEGLEEGSRYVCHWQRLMFSENSQSEVSTPANCISVDSLLIVQESYLSSLLICLRPQPKNDQKIVQEVPPALTGDPLAENMIVFLQSRAGPSCWPVLMSSLQRYRNGHIHDCQGLAGNTKSVFQSRGQVLLTVLRRKEYKKSQMSKQKDEVKAESMGGLLGRREKFGSGPGLQTCMAVCGGLSLWPGDSIPDVFKKFSVKMSGEEGPGGLVGWKKNGPLLATFDSIVKIGKDGLLQRV
ncbi:hypothetical protein MJG53_011578 [Ovis ammon polii x Ovis aries]|uniref:Uncharacterized protein n=1 Tax=Ovis ammon polii x Ovis aries TaxID=2918886 RepID=A0ACB9UPX0_9CETA|nr:hypothetical protein MJG53_011578 [Ovis ammon polii x Ovis aries]